MLTFAVDIDHREHGACHRSLCLCYTSASSWSPVDVQAMFCWIELLLFKELVTGPASQQVISDYSSPKVSILLPTDHTPSHKPLLRGAPLSNSPKGPVLAGDDSDIISSSCLHQTDWELRMLQAGRTQHWDLRGSLWGTSGLVPVVSLPSLSQL